jgi:ubiquinone/menaquinone biosynthesis C-methylase UbiE
MVEHDPERKFLPAAGRDLFLPFYDPFSKMLGADRVRRRLIEQAALRKDQRVLEIGCGTGSLIVDLKKRHPDVEVIGLDPDPKALDRAHRKARRARVALELDRGFANELPYSEATFDRVLSCLMFHHIPAHEKDATLREVRRVLKPGARYEMVDLEGATAKGHGGLFRLLHSHERIADNSAERILGRLNAAGFSEVRSVGSASMLFGRVVYYQASAGD